MVRSRASFTLVEMIVVIAIMTMLAAVVLGQNINSKNQTVLLNAAYDLSLVLREAQTYGVSTRETAPGSAEFGKAYGVAFSSSDLSGAVLFQDANNNQEYDSGESISAFVLPRLVSMEKFCGVRANGHEDCSSNGSLTKLAVLFTRPRPDAVIQSVPRSNDHAEASIYLISASGGTRTVTVYATGQIAVQ